LVGRGSWRGRFGGGRRLRLRSRLRLSRLSRLSGLSCRRWLGRGGPTGRRGTRFGLSRLLRVEHALNCLLDVRGGWLATRSNQGDRMRRLIGALQIELAWLATIYGQDAPMHLGIESV